MRIADEAYNEAAEAAIARVLMAERMARDSVEQARRQVEGIVERARLDARALDARTERRVRAAIAAFERRLNADLAEIDAAAERAAQPQPLTDDERAALRLAVRAVAEELVAAPP
ncbi:MAG TPA: hypothetical protein VMU47_03545 [Caldimonas sp.]|nr:hypothetical protein [Caldimonas sp.]